MSSAEQEALKQQVINAFTDTALTGCVTLLDTLPETVYRMTDLPELTPVSVLNILAFPETNSLPTAPLRLTLIPSLTT